MHNVNSVDSKVVVEEEEVLA